MEEQKIEEDKIQEVAPQKSAKKNYIYNLIYQIVLIIVPIFVTPYLSRILLADGIGKYSYSLSIVTYFTLFASFGFTTYGQRLIARNKDKHQQSLVFWEIVILKCITSLISLGVFIVLVSTGVFGEKYTALLWIMTLNILSSLVDITFLYYGNDEFKKISIRNIVLKFINIILIFIFIKEYNDLWKYCLIQSGFTLISSLYLWFSINKMVGKVRFNELQLKRHLMPCLMIFLPSIATTIYTVLDKTLIGSITGSDASVGNYQNAEKIVKLPMTVITSLYMVFASRNSYYYQIGRYDLLQQSVKKVLKFVWMLAVPMTLGIFTISSNLIPWYLGEEYGADNINEVILMMKILCPIIIFIGFGTTLGGSLLIPTNKEIQAFICTITGAVVNLAMNIAFINLWGAIGACISTTIAEGLVTILHFIFCRKYINFKEMLISFIKPLIAGIVMFTLIYFIDMKLSSSILNTMIILGTGVVSYFLMLLILRDDMFISIINGAFKKIKGLRK